MAWIRTIIFITIFILSNFPIYSQNWSWATKAKTTAKQTANKICSDNAGNVYVLGNNKGKASYGSAQLDTGSFVVKYNSYGNVQWARNIPGVAVDISSDVYGNLFLAGNFTGSISVGSITITSNGSGDFFLAKFNASGLVVWAKSFGGKSNDKVLSLAVDKKDNAYITGFYKDSIYFGNTTLKDSTSYGFTSFFLTKIDSSGIVKWATSGPNNYPFTGNGVYSFAYTYGSCIRITKSQDIFTIGCATWPNSPAPEIFITKYNSFGAVKLNITPGGGDWSDSFSQETFALDDSSNIFHIWNSATHYSYAPELIKYDSLGRIKWQRAMSDGGYDPAYVIEYGLSTDSLGNVYTTGYIGNSRVRDTLQICNQQLHIKGGTDLLVGKFDANGVCSWYKTAGGRNGEGVEPLNMCVDRKGNCYVIGAYNVSQNNISSDTAYFDSNIIYNDGGWSQVFVAKLSVENPATGVYESFNEKNELSVYPNPTKGMFTIESKRIISSIEIRNITGGKIKSFYPAVSKTTIDISDKPAGVYLIAIIYGSEKVIRKIIIE